MNGEPVHEPDGRFMKHYSSRTGQSNYDSSTLQKLRVAHLLAQDHGWQRCTVKFTIST
jgi:hypothetical protein